MQQRHSIQSILVVPRIDIHSRCTCKIKSTIRGPKRGLMEPDRPAVMQILVAFSGFLISHTPVFFRWIAKMSFVSFAYSALYQNEFDGLQMHLSSPSASSPASNPAGEPIY